MIILDLDVDDVYNAVELATFREQICRVFIFSDGSRDITQDSKRAPSQTLSKQRSSQVMTTSATVDICCQRSGARFNLRFRSSICSKPLAVYLGASSQTARTSQEHKHEQSRIFIVELLVNVIVWCTKLVDVGLVH